MSRQDRTLWRVEKGCLVPHDEHTVSRLREKGHRRGDILSAHLTKPRNPRFHRFMHAFGRLLAENLDDFEGMDAHAVLKRLQWEANVGCEEMGVQAPGVGFVTIRLPLSLSFASMDEGEVNEVFNGMCRHVCQRYWPDLDPDQVAQMVDMMDDAA